MDNQDNRSRGVMPNVTFGKSKTKSATKTNQSTEGRSSARWDAFLNLKFVEENGDYSKFRNKDLSLFWFRYDNLFSDILYNLGERARAPNQKSGNEVSGGEEMFDDNGESNDFEEHVEIGDSDDNNYIETDCNKNSEMKETNNFVNENMFPSFAPAKKRNNGENSKGKKKVSGAASLKEDIQSLLQFMEKKSSDTSTHCTDVSIAAAMEILNNMPGIAPMSDLWNYACNLFCKKDMREVFVCQPSHESRLSWLEFNYDRFKNKMIL
ncbi:hypothetical protein DH2020_013593 [Rehmannia glutinosa]|uniref:Myb/SANT-like domain-containing protein n=1 Tax=Rehmannia glutinosa TaxID=99300 RepID=A0ABR0X3F1_REHGL